MSIKDILGKKVKQAKSHGGDDVSWKPPLRKRLSPSVFPELYALHKTVGGGMSVPVFCIEQQNDHIPKKNKKWNPGKVVMIRLQKEALKYVDDFDEELGITSRMKVSRQKKYAMHNNGEDGDNDMRKKLCLQRVRNFLVQCEATELTAFLDETHAAGWDTDDLADSFGLALMDTVENFVSMIHEVYPELGRWDPVVTGTRDIQSRLEGTTFREVGADPGTVLYSDCTFEMKGLLPGRWEDYTTVARWVKDKDTGQEVWVESEVKKHFLPCPIFRVLRWRLLDFKNDRVKAEYVAKPDAPFYHRLFGPEGNEVAEKLPRRKPKPRVKKEQSVTTTKRKRPPTPSKKEPAAKRIRIDLTE